MVYELYLISKEYDGECYHGEEASHIVLINDNRLYVQLSSKIFTRFAHYSSPLEDNKCERTGKIEMLKEEWQTWCNMRSWNHQGPLSKLQAHDFRHLCSGFQGVPQVYFMYLIQKVVQNFYHIHLMDENIVIKDVIEVLSLKCLLDLYTLIVFMFHLEPSLL